MKQYNPIHCDFCATKVLIHKTFDNSKCLTCKKLEKERIQEWFYENWDKFKDLNNQFIPENSELYPALCKLTENTIGFTLCKKGVHLIKCNTELLDETIEFFLKTDLYLECETFIVLPNGAIFLWHEFLE
jgi:hypothetical protein